MGQDGWRSNGLGNKLLILPGACRCHRNAHGQAAGLVETQFPLSGAGNHRRITLQGIKKTALAIHDPLKGVQAMLLSLLGQLHRLIGTPFRQQHARGKCSKPHEDE